MKLKGIGLLLAAALAIAGCGGSSGDIKGNSAQPASSQAAEERTDAEQDALITEASKAYGEGQYDKAISLCDKVLSKDGNSYKALSLKGVAMAMNGNPAGGEEEIRKALSVKPDYIQADYDLAIALKLQGKRRESTTSFEKVIAADPKNTWSYYGIATNYSDDRNKDKALEYLKKAIALDGEHVKPEARTQDHFQWLHGDADFEKLVN